MSTLFYRRGSGLVVSHMTVSESYRSSLFLKSVIVILAIEFHFYLAMLQKAKKADNHVGCYDFFILLIKYSISEIKNLKKTAETVLPTK